MFLNPERSMLDSTEQDTKVAESSHENTEYLSDVDDTESEEASTESDNDVLASIQYPSPPPVKNFPLHFPKPYLHNQDFKDSNQALRYIMKHSNPEMIHHSLWQFPDLRNNLIYSNTYVDTNHFIQLQHYIKKSIHNWDAKWLELYVRYSSSTLNPYIVQCIF